MGRYSTPIQGLINRLKYHAQKGKTPARMLAGLIVIDVPETDVEGGKDFPSVRLFVPDMNERFSPAKNVDGEMEIKLHVATNREKGIPELMRWMEMILDAIQTDTDGEINAIPGTARHFDCDVKDAYPQNNSLNAPLMLKLYPFKHLVGKRSDPPAAPPAGKTMQGVGGDSMRGVGGELLQGNI